MARAYRTINIDADPGRANFTRDQIARLKAGGRNRVLSYLNLGSIEHDRDYWKAAPAGYVAASANKRAQIGPYKGYPDEVWMDPSNADWQRLLVDLVAPRLVAQGVDGFYFDNLELVEHGTDTDNGPCSTACSQAGLDMVRRLRERFPSLLFVMQNGTGDVTRLGQTGGRHYAELLDGVSHEDTFTTFDRKAARNDEDVTYRVSTDRDVVAELSRWREMHLTPGGRSFLLLTEDYVNSCDNSAAAKQVYERARKHGFSPYVADKSALQNTVCYWSI